MLMLLVLLASEKVIDSQFSSIALLLLLAVRKMKKTRGEHSPMANADEEVCPQQIQRGGYKIVFSVYCIRSFAHII